MDDGASARSMWSLRGTVGKLTNGPLSGEVDVAQPKSGVALQGIRSRSVAVRTSWRDAQSMGHRPLQRRMTAASMRGHYPLPTRTCAATIWSPVIEPVDDWPYAPQIYWQANALESVDGVSASMSLLVSVQTHLLDTWPRISVVSQASQ